MLYHQLYIFLKECLPIYHSSKLMSMNHRIYNKSNTTDGTCGLGTVTIATSDE